MSFAHQLLLMFAPLIFELNDVCAVKYGVHRGKQRVDFHHIAA